MGISLHISCCCHAGNATAQYTLRQLCCAAAIFGCLLLRIYYANVRGEYYIPRRLRAHVSSAQLRSPSFIYFYFLRYARAIRGISRQLEAPRRATICALDAGARDTARRKCAIYRAQRDALYYALLLTCIPSIASYLIHTARCFSSIFFPLALSIDERTHSVFPLRLIGL